MKESPSNYINRDGYRVPVQTGVDGGGFEVNRQLVSPNEGSMYTAGGNTLARSTRGGAATGSLFDYRQSPLVGKYYYPSWGSGVTFWSMLVGDLGLTFVAPMHVKIGDSFDRIRARVGNAFDGSFNTYIYSLDPDTWLPDAYLLNAGAMVWSGAGGDVENTISFTASVSLIGLGAKYSIQNALNPSFYTKPVAFSDPWPPGWDPTANNIALPSYYRIQSTGDPTDVSTFTLTTILASEQQKLQPLVALRRA